MLTRPKLSEPFQVVRMRLDCSRDRVSSSPRGFPIPLAQRRLSTGRRQRARRSARCGATPSRRATRRLPYLVERDGGWQRVSWDEAARRVDELANGLLALGVRKGDAFAILGATRSSGRSSTSRSRSSARSARPSTRTARRRTARTSSSTPRRSASLVEDEEQRAKIEASAPAAAARHVSRSPTSTSCASSGRAFAARAPGRARRGRRRRSTRTTSSRTSTRRARPARRRAA